MKKVDHAGLRTWIEIDRKAIAHNYKQFRKLLKPSVRLMAIAKSNAYGHYFVDCVREMEKLGVDWIGVDSITEALALRKEGIKIPILILGYTLPEKFEEAAKNDVSFAVSTFESLSQLKKLKGRAKVHIKIDTGMHRHGFVPEQVPKLLAALKKFPKNIEIEGVFSHLAAKDPSVLRTNHDQIRAFETVKADFAEAGFSPLFHLCATWGTLAYPEAQYDMVRVGMGLYGHYPSALSRDEHAHMALHPALSWKSLLAEVKKLPVGGGVGYDLTEELPPGSVIGIVPVGYWHGVPRALSSKGYVLVRGKRARIVGRVSMDIIAILLSDVFGAKVGDEVVLIGRQGREEVTAEEIAMHAATTPYEILTRLNPLMKRIFI